MVKVNTRPARFLLIILILSLALTACGDVIIDGSSSRQNSQSNQTRLSSPDATATFGASEFNLQLTAIASQEATPPAP